MHAVDIRRRILTSLVPALLAGIMLTGDSLRAGETAVAANPSSGEITVIPQSSLLSGRRATQQMIATSRARTARSRTQRDRWNG